MGYTTFGNYKKENGIVVLSFHDSEYEHVESESAPTVLSGTLKYYVSTELGYQLALCETVDIPSHFFSAEQKDDGFWQIKTTPDQIGEWLEAKEVSDKYNIASITLETIAQIFETILADLDNDFQRKTCKKLQAHFLTNIHNMDKAQLESELYSNLDDMFSMIAVNNYLENTTT